MTLLDIENTLHVAGVTPVRKTFKALSESDTGNNVPVEYATSDGGYCEMIEGIDFDEVTRISCAQLPHTVKSVDVLYAYGGHIYLIEFKTGEAPAADVYRKFYDSCITLVRSGIVTFDLCREVVIGMLVRKDASRVWPHYDLRGTSRPVGLPRYEYNTPTDLSLMNPSEDFRILSSYLLKKVYVMDPADFDSYGQEKGWR